MVKFITPTPVSSYGMKWLTYLYSMNFSNAQSMRKALIQEVMTIHLLAKQIWPKAFERLLNPAQIQYMMNRMYQPEVLEAEIKSGVAYYIFSMDQKDIGYTALERQDNHCFKLHKIYLAQQFHGRGLGKWQLIQMESLAKQQGGRYISLNVNRQNSALTFYKAQGYEVVLAEDIDIGQGYFMNDYRMEKELK